MAPRSGPCPRRRSAHARPRSPPPDRRPHPGRRRTSRPSRASPRPARFAPHTHQWWKRSFLVRDLASEGVFRSLPRLPFSYQSSEEQQGGAKACGLGGARPPWSPWSPRPPSRSRAALGPKAKSPRRGAGARTGVPRESRSTDALRSPMRMSTTKALIVRSVITEQTGNPPACEGRAFFRSRGGGLVLHSRYQEK